MGDEREGVAFAIGEEDGARVRMGGVDGRALAPATLKMAAAAIVMGICLYGFLVLARGQSIWLIAAGTLLVGGSA